MLKARDYIPALKYGAKIFPQDIAGMIGLPYVGNIFYVDPTNGSDSSDGTTEQTAFATMTAAYASLTNNHHDVVIVAPSGPGTGEPYATVETAAITWSKNQCHVIGNTGPNPVSPRARVATVTAGLSPFITVSGQGNTFRNVQFYNPATTNYINVRVSGNRNYFENVHFAGPANSTAATNAGAAALELYGAQENRFVGCTIGLDTITRTSTSANLRLTLGSDTVARNIFDGCVFPLMTSVSTTCFVKQPDASGLDRWNLFRGCQFVNCTSSTSTTITDAFLMNSAPAGMLVLQDCLKIGATGWADNLSDVYLLAASSSATYNQGIGFAVNAAA